jgi:formate/nitrite transporter FocA (FNT family)
VGIEEPDISRNRPDRDAQPSPDGGRTVQLSEQEEQEVEKRTALRAAVVFESVRREGETELKRPVAALSFSGFAAGLSMGFSLATTALLRAYLPDAPWRVLVENFGYTIGFLIVVMGRQQLFTENTLTVILPLLDDAGRWRTLRNVARLWAVVLAANIVGALAFAFAAALSDAFPPQVKQAMLALGQHAASDPFAAIVMRGVFAGWLIALMVWLLPVAESGRVAVIIIITYIVGAAGFSHIIAGSVEVLYAVAAGGCSWGQYLGGFLLPVFIGNVIGGVALVSLLNYGQVAPESER